MGNVRLRPGGSVCSADMNLAQVTSADLKRIAKLLEQKESLQAQITKIDTALSQFEVGQPGATAKVQAAKGTGAKASRSGTKAKRAARGAVKAAIMDLIQAAGESGVTVKDIAAKLGVSYNRVFTWFYNTGSKIKEIKKAGPGRYAWAGGAPRAIRPAPAPRPTPKPKPRPTAPTKAVVKKAAPAKRGKPGVTKEGIVELLKGAGAEGITVKDLAVKLGVNPQRLYVWFGATGKAVKEIKKVAPAKYAWVS